MSFDLPAVRLLVGDQSYTPDVSIGPRNAEHHRITIYSFPKRNADGSLIDAEAAGGLQLEVSNRYLGSAEPLTFVAAWNTPHTLPAELTSAADITPIAMLALGAGLLSSVLTPCLLQLVVVFGSIIGGFASVTGGNENAAAVRTHVRRKIMQIALVFVLGFTSLYVLAGALIGAIGHSAQMVFAEYSRLVAIVSGTLVILLGLWVGIRGHRGAACRVVDRRVIDAGMRGDQAGALAVSMGYALGCTACFGGAIVATLVIYVGAIGSALVGAGIMATFSIGVAIPFLLSAWYLSRMDSVLQFLTRHQRRISYASMALIVGFGLILVTDNFHSVSDAIYPWLGLR